MSNIVPFNAQVPAHMTNRVGQQSALAASLSGGLSSGADYPRISIKSSRFRIVQGGADSLLPDLTLAVVVVGANPNLSKAFYASAWNPDAEASAPDCFTLEGTRPDANSSQPQNDLCSTCPHNAWGSKLTDAGTKIKACADKKRLAVVAADDPSGAIYLLEVTAAALKNLNQYQRELSTHGIAPEIARTIVSFDTSASFPKLKFDFGGFLDEATQTVVDTLFGTPKVLEITGEGMAGVVPAAAVAPPVIAAPKPVAEPVVAVASAGGPAAFGTPEAVTPEAVTPEAAPTPTAFGKPADLSAELEAAVNPAPKPVAEEPAAAPSGTSALADDITQLMKEVADDAPAT